MSYEKLDNWAAHHQFRLQGHEEAQTGMPAPPEWKARIGNIISDLRYWVWRLRGGAA